jgi:hypothetical protein
MPAKTCVPRQAGAAGRRVVMHRIVRTDKMGRDLRHAPSTARVSASHRDVVERGGAVKRPGPPGAGNVATKGQSQAIDGFRIVNGLALMWASLLRPICRSDAHSSSDA